MIGASVHGLQRLGIAHLAARSARTLSGGEAQRTSLARALVLEPELLLLDEPFSALDPASREALLRDFQGILKETGITTVFVTHDRHEAFALANRVGVLNQGYLLQLGSRENVFLRPETESVAEIVGIENRLAGVVETSDGDYVTIKISDGRVHAKGRFSAGTKVVACIRPEEVSLSLRTLRSERFKPTHRESHRRIARYDPPPNKLGLQGIQFDRAGGPKRILRPQSF